MESNEKLFQKAIKKLKQNKQWNQIDGSAVIEALKRSGSTGVQFCTIHGIPYSRLNWWKGNLNKKRKHNDSIPTFYPVKVVEQKESRGQQNQGIHDSISNIEVALSSGRLLKVKKGFDPETLKQLIEVLEACPC